MKANRDKHQSTRLDPASVADAINSETEHALAKSKSGVQPQKKLNPFEAAMAKRKAEQEAEAEAKREKALTATKAK